MGDRLGEDNHSRCTEATTLSKSGDLDHLVDNNQSFSEHLQKGRGDFNRDREVGGRQEGYKRLKLCKRGYREATASKICGVSFEGCPVWLWAMRLTDWSEIVITGTDEERLRQSHVSTWDVVKERLKIVEPKVIPTLVGIDMWFVSGSLEFLRYTGTPPSTPKICWLATAGRRRPAAGANWQWTSVAHARVGGSTTANGMFGFEGLPPVSVPADPIRRSIGHVIKYAERPTPCSVPFQGAHYTVDDRLSIHQLATPVVFSSGFSRTGWGYRALVPSELGQAYDLPSFVSWEPKLSADILPLLLFRVVMEACWEVLTPPGGQGSGVRQKLEAVGSEVKGVIASTDAVWLETIEKWLPGTWADVQIADRAVKSDDAMVDFSPWYNRIRLVLPCPLASLVTFEELGMRTWRRSLTKSFTTYLVRRYGPRWNSGRAEEPSSKRRKVELPKGSTPIRGVLKEDEGDDKDGSKGVEGGDQDGLSSAERVELGRDLMKGRAILTQVLQSSWWEWSFGSSLYFWRWNGIHQQRAARDGMRSFVHQTLPSGRKAKRVKMNPEVLAMVANKLEGMTKRSYLEEGHVTSVVDYFPVAKGDADIRVVFDGSSCGLNSALWAPNFYLPSASAAVMLMSFSTWMSDMDFGEMFHNFPMEDRLRKCSGVEFKTETNKTKILRWSRLFMGMKPSPYGAVRYYYWGEEVARGDPSNIQNPMGYDSIRLNLPGMEDYEPEWPKVMKWASKPGAVAGDAITFVDDVRMTGYSKENCHAVHRQFASTFQWLGMQDAPRKFRPPSQQDAGAWTGTIFRIGPSEISKSVSQEKWDKGRAIVFGLIDRIKASSDGRPVVNRKGLERETGFLNHLAMTFEVVSPYLKGFYLTLNSWRSHRDEGDWKMTDKQWQKMVLGRRREEEGRSREEGCEEEILDSDIAEAPSEVTASPSLGADVAALGEMFAQVSVPVVRVRCRKVLTVIYGFGDASGTGLGATFTCGSGFNFRIGVWGADEDIESSNWKEFTNVVEALEEEGAEGNLNDSEVFMFTDNATVESCVHRGSSSSCKLLSLVVRLQSLSLRIGIKIHVFHVAGTRMIAQGTDGVSRGYLGHGVMAGETMSAFIPLHLGAGQRGKPSVLMSWIREWAGAEAIVLNEMGWYQQGHDIEGWERGEDGRSRPKIADGPRTYIWAPAPMAAEVALGELRKARIKRQSSAHIFVCPRLCCNQWLRHLFKAADFVFEVPVGSSFWGSDMHEPLLIGVLFPFIRVEPWQLRGSPKMFAVGGKLRKVFQESEVDACNLLREFWTCCHDLQGLPKSVVRRLLYIK